MRHGIVDLDINKRSSQFTNFRLNSRPKSDKLYGSVWMGDTYHISENLNATRTITAIGRAHLPPTTVFRRLKTTRRCCGRRRITMLNTCTWDFPDVIKFRALQCIRYRRKQSGSGIRTMIRIGLKS